MKKILSMLVVVSIVALSAMGAFAADFLPDDNGRYTVEVTGLKAGEMYGMVAIKGTQASQITEANIVYIDQATADSEGKISFTSFGTMGAAPDSKDFVEATVFVGGAGYTSATAIGTLKPATVEEPEPPSNNVTISGTIVDTASNVNSVRLATVSVIDGDEVVGSVAVKTGEFSISVPAKAGYTISIKKPAFCAYTITDVDASADVNLAPVDITALGGNANGSEVAGINYDDLAAVTGNYYASATVEDLFDVNGSGAVNFDDLQIVLDNYYTDHAVVPYSGQ